MGIGDITPDLANLDKVGIGRLSQVRLGYVGIG